MRVEPRRRLWRSRTRWNVALAWWHAELLDEHREIQPNPAEVAEVHWLTAAELRTQRDLLESNYQFLDALARAEFELPGLPPD